MAEEMYVEQFDDVLRHSLPKAGVAGFFAEAIQVTAGLQFRILVLIIPI